MSTPAKVQERRRSGGKPSLVVLRVSPDSLRKIFDSASVKEESPAAKDPKASPAASATLPSTEAPAAVSNGDNASESNPSTPAPAAMGPPTEGSKKKGVKRSAAGANGMEPKIRGKPGPKKKPRLEDGTIDPNARGGNAYHKLGPKANMGAINAGLRALDRSGKPCRKWNRGGFQLKSFTGTVWQVSRWTAPQKPLPEEASKEPSVSAESSNKENKEGSQLKSENSNSGADGERPSVPASVAAPSSPAPVPVSAVS